MNASYVMFKPVDTAPEYSDD